VRKCRGASAFENSLSFQQSRSSAASAQCARFANYRTDAAPVWRDHYVTLANGGNCKARGGFKF